MTYHEITGPHFLAVSGGKPSIPSPEADCAKMEGALTVAPGRGLQSVNSGQAATTHTQEQART